VIFPCIVGAALAAALDGLGSSRERLRGHLFAAALVAYSRGTPCARPGHLLSYMVEAAIAAALDGSFSLMVY